MNSRNGVSKNFKFIIEGVHYTFSFKHQALEEWTDDEKWIYHEFDDGSSEQKFLHMHHYFRIDWSGLIIGEDSDKYKTVRNAEFAGKPLKIIPHLDVPNRSFIVISVKSSSGEGEKKEFSQISNNRNSPGNKGLVATYRTKDAVRIWSTYDPSLQHGISAMTFEEYI